jgi:hypothetical protein
MTTSVLEVSIDIAGLVEVAVMVQIIVSVVMMDFTQMDHTVGVSKINFHRLHILHQHTHVHVFKKHCFEHYLQISNYKNRNIPFIN